MYKNIGGKIKGLAKGIFIVQTVLCVMIGIFIIFSGSIIFNYSTEIATVSGIISLIVGIAVIAIGTLLAWISSWLLYGFGELIEKTCNLEKHFCTEHTENAKGPYCFKCPGCGNDVAFGDAECKSCGQKFD